MEESIGVAYLQRAGLGLYKDFVFPLPLRRTLTGGQKENLRKAVSTSRSI